VEGTKKKRGGRFQLSTNITRKRQPALYNQRPLRQQCPSGGGGGKERRTEEEGRRKSSTTRRPTGKTGKGRVHLSVTTNKEGEGGGKKRKKDVTPKGGQ